MSRHPSNSKPLTLILCGALAACVSALAAPGPAAGGSDPHAFLADFQRPTKVPASRANPSTPEKIALGQMLFFDPRLSGSGVISCATCHNPALGWSDGLPKGLGHMGGRLGRRTPTIIDVAYGEPYFWDGRAATLEDQAKGPLTSAAEMNMPAAQAISRLQSIPGYVAAFDQAFPGQGVSLDTFAAAVASYERTVVSNSAPFDKWVQGDEQAVLAAAKRGFVLFNGKANCAVCHSGWRMSDDGFHDIGLPSAESRSRGDRSWHRAARACLQDPYLAQHQSTRSLHA
jgi:cytochrome c peroxidase